MPSLTLIKSPGGTAPRQTYRLTQREYILGREDTCGIVIPNTSVSRKHARLTVENGQCFIEDLKSRNLTFLNNQEVATRTRLKHDDCIKICDFLYRFEDENAAPRPKPLLDDAPPEQADDGGSMSTIEATLPVKTQASLLQTQPADMLRALLEISSSLTRTLELNAVFHQIVEAVLGVFKQADRCFIIMKEEGGHLVARAVKARRSIPGDDHKFSKTIVRRCLTSKESYLSEDAAGDAALGAAQSIAEFRIRSVMCVPLLTPAGEAVGAIQLDTQDRSKKFKESDLQLLAIVANLAGVAVEQAAYHEHELDKQKLQKEIEIASKVQLGFLPQSVPDLDGYEFYATYSPALTVGGDYYDFISLPDGRIAVILGDVAGKGVPAALLMAKLSAEARYCILTQPDPAAAVNLLNEQLIRGGIGDRFVTLALLLLDPFKHTLTVVNAGHINPVRFRHADGSFDDIISNDDSGLPLGLVSGFEYSAFPMPIEPGDTLIVYTDGVTDATAPNGDMFGPDAIIVCLHGSGPDERPCRPGLAGERLLHAVRKHAAGRPQADDIAIVTFGRLAPDALASDSSRLVNIETFRLPPA